MDRHEAVYHIWSLARGIAGEFAISDAERDKIRQEVTDALLALGVEQHEIPTEKDDERCGFFDDYQP